MSITLTLDATAKNFLVALSKAYKDGKLIYEIAHWKHSLRVEEASDEVRRIFLAALPLLLQMPGKEGILRSLNLESLNYKFAFCAFLLE